MAPSAVWNPAAFNIPRFVFVFLCVLLFISIFFISAANCLLLFTVGVGGFCSRGAFARAMTNQDLTDVCAQFVSSALLAARVGFDAVELHIGHGYLLSQACATDLSILSTL